MSEEAINLPTPPEVEDKVENAVEQTEAELKELEKKAKEIIQTDGAKAEKELKKAIDKTEKESIKLYEYVAAKLSDLATGLKKFGSNAQSTSSSVFARTVQEFHNPVVIVQALIGVSGLAAGYAVYVERGRIIPNNRVICAHASILTGLVVLDGYLFNRYYPVYDKKFKK